MKYIMTNGQILILIQWNSAYTSKKKFKKPYKRSQKLCQDSLKLSYDLIINNEQYNQNHHSTIY